MIMATDKFEIHGNHAVYPNGAVRPLSADERTRIVVKEAMARLEPDGYVREPNGFLRKQSIGERARAVAEDFVRSTVAGDQHEQVQQSGSDHQDPHLAGQSELFDEKPAKKQDKTEKKKERGFFDVHFPPEAKVAKMSNDILRSGLFSVRKRVHGQNVMVERKEIATIGDAKIYLTGMELDQDDYKVYEGLIQQYMENGTEIITNIPGLLRIVGYPDSSSYRESLLETLRRLNSCRVEVITKRYRYLGGLVNGITIDKENDKVSVTLGKELAVMFAKDNWTRLDVSERERLGKNALAFRVFNVASTHKQMFPYTRQTLRRLSGNENVPQKKFNQKLKQAVELINAELSDLGWHAEIKDDRLEITRSKAAMIEEESTIYLR